MPGSSAAQDILGNCRNPRIRLGELAETVGFLALEHGTTLPTKRLSMRKVKEALRFCYELGLGHRQITRRCSVRQGTDSGNLKCLEAAAAVGRCRKAGKAVTWNLLNSGIPREAPTKPARSSEKLEGYGQYEI